MSLLTSRMVPRLWGPSSLLQIRNFAARKGTRERKEKRTVKKAVTESVGFVPHNQRKKEALLAARPKLKYDDSMRGLPVDDVYSVKYYKYKYYPFEEAVQNHRETHHPTMYNVPNAPLHLTIELYMQGEKKTRFVEDFFRVAAIPYPYDHGEQRPVIVFAKTAQDQEAAREAGAELAGGVELIKQIQNGNIDLQNFEYAVAHPDILPEMVSLRGLMKRKFPTPRNGTLDVDVAAVTKRLMYGISYQAKKDGYEKDFGVINTILGSLDTDAKHLEANFEALIQDVDKMKPKRAGGFISRCLLWSPPSREKFRIDQNLYLKSDTTSPPQQSKDNEEVEEEEEGERVAL